VLPVVSSAIFLSLRPSLIAVGFGSSSQLFSRSFSFRYDGGEDGRSSGKARVVDRIVGMTERASTPLSICLSDPQGVAQEGAQNSVKKGVHFGTYRSRVSVHASYETLTLAHPAREVQVFKATWCG
jgi:hypothetical protein